MKISVVMVCYDRNEQLKNTLNSYAIDHPPKSADLEVIIVEEHKNAVNKEWHEKFQTVIDTFQSTWRHKVIVLDDPFIGTYNPCKKLNLGVSKSSGDVIIITNPENIHCGNIFEDIEYKLKHMPRKWFVWACKSENGYWHQHSHFAPHGWHYLAAGTRKTWDEIGGFDERFEKFISWEDNDFVRTILQKKIPIIQIDYPFTMHQKHSHTWGLTEDEIQQKIRANRDIYKAKWGDDNITNLKVEE